MLKNNRNLMNSKRVASTIVLKYSPNLHGKQIQITGVQKALFPDKVIDKEIDLTLMNSMTFVRDKNYWEIEINNLTQKYNQRLIPFLTYSQFKSGQILPKNARLKFFPLHSIKPPYVVKWQITNTGDEARRENCLRGNKFESGEIERFGICSGKKEITSYKGTHYVQCFIIKNGTSCEGVSLPFVVRVQ